MENVAVIGATQPKAERQKSSDQGKAVSHHQLINKYFDGDSGAILKE